MRDRFSPPFSGPNMEAILFIGLPASGKSTFYIERFFHSHMRISLDLLKTQNRVRRFVSMCLETGQPMVIDNTNVTRQLRAAFIAASRAAEFRVVGYYFQSKVDDCLGRNATRTNRVPEVAILDFAKKLELPSREEGFDELYYVSMGEAGFRVEEWRDDL